MKQKKKRRFAVIAAALLLGVMATEAALVPTVSAIETTAETATSAQSVTIDETNFPDANFRTVIKDLFDIDNDGVLNETEIKNATKLRVYYFKKDEEVRGEKIFVDPILLNLAYDGIPMDFTGLEYLTSLETLAIDNFEPINLSFEKLPSLRTIYLQSLPSIDLDLSQNQNLTGVHCSKIDTSRLNIKENTALQDLSMEYCSLKTLDVSPYANLENLVLSNNQLTSLDLHNNTKLQKLDVWNNRLTELDLSNNPKLQTVQAPDNQLNKLDLSQNPAVTSVSISGNVFKELTPSTIKVAEKSTLASLSAVGMNSCTTVDVSHISSLKTLYAPYNSFTSIRIGANLKTLDLMSAKKLTILDQTTLQAPSNNKLTKLDVSGCEKLEKLSISHLTKVWKVDASDNSLLSHINFTGNTNLKSINVDDDCALKTVITNQQISDGAKKVLQKIVKSTGGKITYIPDQITGLKAIKKTQTTLTLRWNAVSGASGYKVYDAETGKVLANVSTQNGAKTITKTITGLKSGETRKYKVRAYVTVNGTKHYGAYSKVYTKSTAE